jgi:hypothetical protein
MGPALVSRAIHAEQPNEPMLPTVRTAALRAAARPAADWQVVGRTWREAPDYKGRYDE